jgi:antirestriction protein ArdC
MNEQVKAMREDLAGKILSMIDTGNIGKWLQTWRAADAPYNAISKENYKGMNNLHLSFTNHSDPRYMTFKQAQDKGYKVKKGSKGYRVEFWQFFKKEESENDTAKTTGVITRYYTVFNAEQIDGIPALNSDDQQQDIKTIEKAESIIKGCPVSIGYGGASAYYKPSDDKIQMPMRESFYTDAAFYSTMFHEMAHSTGNKTRLDRSMCGRFGDSSYAFEELIAEFAAAFVGKETGIDHDADAYEKHLENHAAYVRSWSRAKFDHKKILEAVSMANKAATMITAWGK